MLVGGVLVGGRAATITLVGCSSPVSGAAGGARAARTSSAEPSCWVSRWSSETGGVVGTGAAAGSASVGL
ncbi:hypothetical protein, partial [Blastococcus sp. CCUG 61487]|uniref:hypothetical protein n=1 Tax=Blastococcus sp. CCUG 61487 TaxID=1840703 RepID=UPI00201E424F